MVLVVVSAKSAKLMAAPEVVRMPPNVVGPTEWVRPPCRSIAVVVVASWVALWCALGFYRVQKLGSGQRQSVADAQRASAVRWGVAGNIVWAWVLTIPASAVVAAIANWLSFRIFD